MEYHSLWEAFLSYPPFESYIQCSVSFPAPDALYVVIYFLHLLYLIERTKRLPP